jgi:glutathione synthase
MVREGAVLEVDSLSELGIYGVFVRHGDKVLLNKEAGHLLRTKVHHRNQ